MSSVDTKRVYVHERDTHACCRLKRIHIKQDLTILPSKEHIRMQHKRTLLLIESPLILFLMYPAPILSVNRRDEIFQSVSIMFLNIVLVFISTVQHQLVSTAILINITSMHTSSC